MSKITKSLCIAALVLVSTLSSADEPLDTSNIQMVFRGSAQEDLIHKFKLAGIRQMVSGNDPSQVDECFYLSFFSERFNLAYLKQYKPASFQCDGIPIESLVNLRDIDITGLEQSIEYRCKPMPGSTDEVDEYHCNQPSESEAK